MRYCNYKMYEAVKNTNRLKPRKPQLIIQVYRMTLNKKEQAQLVAQDFKETFKKTLNPCQI